MLFVGLRKKCVRHDPLKNHIFPGICIKKFTHTLTPPPRSIAPLNVSALHRNWHSWRREIFCPTPSQLPMLGQRLTGEAEGVGPRTRNETRRKRARTGVSISHAARVAAVHRTAIWVSIDSMLGDLSNEPQMPWEYTAHYDVNHAKQSQLRVRNLDLVFQDFTFLPIYTP